MVYRLKAEVANRDSEIQRLRDQLAESDSVHQRQVELLEYKHGKQLEELQRAVADISEGSVSAIHQLEREKNSLEAELAKALQDLIVVKTVSSYTYQYKV